MTTARKGTRLRTLVDIQSTALVHHSGPATFRFDCLIPRGTVLVVYSDPAPITGALSRAPSRMRFWKRSCCERQNISCHTRICPFSSPAATLVGNLS